MSENTNAETSNEQPEEEVIDPIEVVYQGQCLSLSGRSTLDFEVGQHQQDETYHLRISDNSGGGMWCRDWSSAQDIHDIVLGATELTSKSLAPLHEGRSTNGPGFILAALKELGLIRVSALNARHHEHVPKTTLAALVHGHLTAASEPHAKSTRKKAREG